MIGGVPYPHAPKAHYKVLLTTYTDPSGDHYWWVPSTSSDHLADQ